MTEEPQQIKPTDRRMRLEPLEIQFNILVFKEMEKSYSELLAFAPTSLDKNTQKLIAFYNRKLAAVQGMIRRYESILEGGKRQLRGVEKIAMRLVVNQEMEEAKTAHPIDVA